MHLTAHELVYTRHLRMPRRLAGAVVATLMFGVGQAMWTAVPVAILWAARTYVDGAPFALVLMAIVFAMTASAIPLVRLDLLHAKLTGREASGPRGRRGRRPETVTLLDRVLIVSVLSALAAFVAWYALLGQCRASCM